jgi:hypothetical protein
VRGSTSRVTRVSPTRSSTPRRRSSRASSRYFPSPHLIISARRLSLINCLTLQPIWATGPVHQSRPGGLLQGQREEGAGLPHVRRPVQGLVPRRWLHLLSFVCTTYVADPFTGKEIVSLTHKLIRCFFLFLVAPLALVYVASPPPLRFLAHFLLVDWTEFKVQANRQNFTQSPATGGD